MQQFFQEHGSSIALWLLTLFLVCGPPGKTDLLKKQRIVLNNVRRQSIKRFLKPIFGIWTFWYSARGKAPGLSILEILIAAAGTTWCAIFIRDVLDYGDILFGFQRLGVALGSGLLLAFILIIFKMLREAWREMSGE